MSENWIVCKRDGRKQPFNPEKLYLAVKNAAMAAGLSEDDSMVLAANTQKRTLKGLKSLEKQELTADDIQETLVSSLLKSRNPRIVEVCNTYIRFCHTREQQRMMSSNLMEAASEIAFSSTEDSNLKRDNGNVNGASAMGTMLHMGSTLTKDLTDRLLLSETTLKYQNDNLLYIHDKDFYPMGTLTCTQIPLDKLYENGFNTGHGTIRTPQSIESYAALCAVAIQANQNDNHGGQAVPLFDFYMAPGVSKSYKKNIIKALRVVCDFFGEDEEYFVNSVEELDWTNFKRENSKETMNNLIEKFTPLCPEYEFAEQLMRQVFFSAWNQTKRDTHQAMESLLHNLNTLHSRAGAQVPFSSLNYGMDTSEEGRLVTRCFLDTINDGMGNHETAIFPISIFQVKEGVNYNITDPNYDLFQYSMEVSAKRMFPNYVFVDAPFNLQYYDPNDPETIIATMGCRTRVIGNRNGKETPVGRGNLSFSTINLVRMGIRHGILFRQSQTSLVPSGTFLPFDRKGFYEELDTVIDAGINQLLERFAYQKSKKTCNFPFLMEQHVYRGSDHLTPNDSIDDVLNQGTLSLGFIGLAESLVALTGHHHGEVGANLFYEPNPMQTMATTPEPTTDNTHTSYTLLESLESINQFGYEIILHMRRKLDEAAEKTGLNFSLLATPAEGLSGRFTQKDRKQFGVISGVTDRDYYTNSNHVPVYFPIGFTQKIQIEAPYHELTNAGHICYVECDGNISENLPAFEQIIRCMKESGIGYGAVNHPIDRCPVCGYTGVLENVCPSCGHDETKILSQTPETVLGYYRKSPNDPDLYPYPIERLRRITGYLVGTLERFNDYKKAEEKDRVKHA